MPRPKATMLSITGKPRREPLTKAETLAALRGRLRSAIVPDLMYFPVSEWRSDPVGILAGILEKFKGRTVAVRSSSRIEDGCASSLAGHFRSCLPVNCEPCSLTRAIAEVCGRLCEERGDQVLVQEFVSDVQIGGVLFTRHPTTGAPYYVLEYDDETGRTDLVTSGRKRGKREVIAHSAVGRFALPGIVDQVLALSRELEDLLGSQPLDLELAISQAGLAVLLQVRPLAGCPLKALSVSRHSALLGAVANQVTEVSRPVAGLAGSGTLLGQMPDWNPAELLGAHPRPLAVSLFRFLIADGVWRTARAGMGYRQVADQPLVRLLAGRPFVDVRNSFNSLLPAGLSPRTERLLVDAWMCRLRSHPHLHDKVEFEVAQTVSDFCFEANHRSWYPGLLTGRAYLEYTARLRELTRRNLSLNGSLARALQKVSSLERRSQPPVPTTAPLSDASSLLRECRDRGTLPFAVIARHAFIAEAFLRSLVGRNVWDRARLSAFRSSVQSVSSDVGNALLEVRAGRLSHARFDTRFGHLRPSSFDIRSYRYDRSPELFYCGRTLQSPVPGSPGARPNSGRAPDSGAGESGHNNCPPPLFCHRTRREEPPPSPASEQWALPSSERRSIDRLLKEAGCHLNADQLLEYCRTAIRGREHAKLLFTRNLSDALELIAGWGESVGLTREELSFFSIDDLFSGDRPRLRNITQKRREYEDEGLVQLPPLICAPGDVYRIVEAKTAPNFVTSRSAQGAPARVSPRDRASSAPLSGKIVLIESADPGFDWIFSERIGGLITKFGGSNSHMAIRCAELSLPAAIGVGERLFEALLLSPRIELSCGDGTVRGLYV